MKATTIEVDIVNKVKGIHTCSVCGREFALTEEDHYIVRDVEKTGVLPALTGSDESELYDAIDCPHCGCQNILQGRKRIYECKSDDNDRYDGCIGCKYEDKMEDEDPCCDCSHCYADYFVKEEDEEDE